MYDKLKNIFRDWTFDDFITVSDKGTLAAFLLLATLIWFLGAMGKDYTYEIPVEITYENIPENRVATRALEEELLLTVKGEGSALFRKYRELSGEALKLDLSKFSNNARVPVRSLFPQIAEQFSGLEVAGIQPDSLYLLFSEATRKKVPLLPVHELSFDKQFDLASVQLAVDSVSLHGPIEVLKDIDKWQTESINHEMLSSTTKGVIGIKESSEFGISVEPKMAKYTVEIDEFTEKSAPSIIEAINLPIGAKVILYPNTAQLTFQVSVSEYKQTDGEDFQIRADFADVDLNAGNRVPIQLLSKPLRVKNVQLAPTHVEYIIYTE